MRIRRRLVAWYTGILAGLLLVFTAGLYLALRHHLLMEVDESIAAWSRQLTEAIGDDALRLPPEAGRAVAGISAPDSFALLLAPAGRIVGGQAPRSKRVRLGLGSLIKREAAQAGLVETIAGDGQSYRVHLSRLTPRSGEVLYLAVGRSLAHVRTTLEDLGTFLVFAWVAAVCACSLLAWVLIGRTLRPVQIMTRDSLRIADLGELSQRLEEGGDRDEFGELARALNHMLSSLEASHLAQRRFLADVSHELRTPLTSIKANLDYLERADKAPPREKNAARRDIVTEVDRLAGLVNELLASARAEAAQVSRPARLERVDLAELAREAATRLRGGRRVQFELAREVCPAGDPGQLRQVIVILLDNALKYSPVGKEVRLTVRLEAGEAVLQVADNGPGIPRDELPLVTERFYRGTNIRNITPGSGLGLAIAKAIVDSHGGRLVLRNLDPRGLAAEVRLPVGDSGA